MNIRAWKIVFLNLLFAVNFFSTVWAGEALLKVANVSDRVMDKYIIKTGGGFFTERNDFYDVLLEQALYSGVKAELVSPKDLGRIHRIFVLKKGLREARREIKELFPFTGSLVGRQDPAGSSAWNKFIFSFKNQGDRRDYIAEIEGEDAPGSKEVSHIAVKNKEGELEKWEISDKPPGQVDSKTVYRINQAFFMRQLRRNNAFSWLQSVMPANDGVRMMVIRKEFAMGFGDSSDTVLVWIHPEGLPQKQEGMPEAAIVLGWKHR